MKKKKMTTKEVLGEIFEGIAEFLVEIILVFVGCAVLLLFGGDPEVVGDDGAALIGIAAIVAVVIVICVLVKLIRRMMGRGDESKPTGQRVHISGRRHSNAEEKKDINENMKKIVFDTDIGGDCDDAGALAIIHRAEQRGLAKLLALTVSTRDPWAPACADAINKYYGHEVPIGLCRRAPAGDPTMAEFLERYGKHIAETFPCKYAPKPVECTMCGSAEQPEDAVLLLRRTLAWNKGSKITLVVVGSCVNLAALLESEADDISSLDGVSLVSESVDKVVLMGGFFAENEGGDIMAEYNIKTDISGARVVFGKCPVPIAVSHFDVGLRVMSGSALITNELELGNPAAESYRFHVGGKRHSWDPIAAFYAVYGCEDVFTDTRCGRISVDESGVTRLIPIEGNHRLIDCPDVLAAEAALDRAMTELCDEKI